MTKSHGLLQQVKTGAKRRSDALPPLPAPLVQVSALAPAAAL
jgi:hypothetical protein